MTDYGEPTVAPHGHVTKSPISVGWVVLASVLCGIGLTAVWWWVTTFDWRFFPGAALVILGGLMFLNPRAGLDHA